MEWWEAVVEGEPKINTRKVRSMRPMVLKAGPRAHGPTLADPARICRFSRKTRGWPTWTTTPAPWWKR